MFSLNQASTSNPSLQSFQLTHGDIAPVTVQAVAVKVMQLVQGPDNPMADSFKRELAVLMHISHCCDHVCRYLGFTCKEGKFCIVMRLYKQSLSQMIDDQGEQ